MDLKIVTLDHPRPLTREERRIKEARRAASVSGVIVGFILGVVLVATASGVGTAQAVNRYQEKTTGKLEIPAFATVSLLDMVEISEPEQTSRRWDVPLTDEELAALLEACEVGHIDPTIGLGLIRVESNFRADALNPRSGCYGYCQLNPRYFPSDLSPVDNIRTGIGFLAYQLERYDNLEAALTAYNAGYDTGNRTYANMVLEAAASFGG